MRCTKERVLLALALLLIFKLMLNKEQSGIGGGKDLSLERQTDAPLDPGSVPLHQEDPRLVDYVRNKLQYTPPDAKYHLSPDWNKGEMGAQNGQMGQVPILVDYFNGTRGGFFVEAGAFNGEALSNTLFLEVEYGWTGLLVEPNTRFFNDMKTKNRKAAMIRSCFSTTQYSGEVSFDLKGAGGKILDGDKGDRVQTIPFYTMLLALGNPRVDLLSLDVNGPEDAVMCTIPWDKVDIQAILVEVAHTNKTVVAQLMEKHGYRIHHNFKNFQDVLFVKN